MPILVNMMIVIAETPRTRFARRTPATSGRFKNRCTNPTNLAIKPSMKKAAIMIAALAASPIAVPTTANAEVKDVSDRGFVIIHTAEVSGSPEEIWKRLIAPKQWWSKEHSWSGSVAGFYIDAQANGCFCELFQEKDKNGKLKTVGSVEHMRVIFAQPGKVLRMQGALGPLQSEAVIGTLTVAMAPRKEGEGSKVSLSYVVGGYMRYKVADIAPAVDTVLGAQFAGLIKPFEDAGPIADKPSNWSLDIDSLTDGESSDKSGSDDKGKGSDKKTDGDDKEKAKKPGKTDDAKSSGEKKER